MDGSAFGGLKAAGYVFGGLVVLIIVGAFFLGKACG
jgi:hypothetical protein